ncbi:MAG: hypothetical protein KAT33_04975 [Bacteroidales bacterium]|nr:hypothetical protein [Bacteroidales bacterium]MCK4638751.1 hypothetical protein [Bacteroidales bacterium]
MTLNERPQRNGEIQVVVLGLVHSLRFLPTADLSIEPNFTEDVLFQ